MNKHPTLKYDEIKITHVSAILDTQKIYVIWDNGEEAVVDFSETIETNKWFQPLKDPEEFQMVKKVSWGWGIEWRCGADAGSDNVRYMGDLQQSVFCKQRKKSA